MFEPVLSDQECMDVIASTAYKFSPMGIARATEKAVLTKLVEEQEPDCYAAFGEHDGGLIYLGYTSETVHGVKNRILTGARNEGYKGTIEGRLFALGWQILPLYIRPALPTKPTTKDAIRAVGGIVHSDGNVFFTNMAQIDALREALKWRK